MILRSLLIPLLLVSLCPSAHALPHADLPLCTRSATLVACKDGRGNYYSVRSVGTTLYLRGYDAAGKRLWSQTNERHGPLTFFTGLASNGEAWVGYSRRVGWTSISRVSSSSGQRFNLHCSLIGGCR
ncbi:glutamine synthetase [Pseudomonas sp. MLB6B]